jgi:hypothetical protein
MAFPFFQAEAGDILGAMITPAVLISAAGTLALSTSNRLARVVDRVRKILSEVEGLPPGNTADLETIEKRNILSDQLNRLAVRIGLLQRTLITLYVAIGLLVGSSIAIGISTSTSEALGFIPAGLGLSGAFCLFLAAILLVSEVRLAVRSSLIEIAYVKRVVARRTGYTETGGPPP